MYKKLKNSLTNILQLLYCRRCAARMSNVISHKLRLYEVSGFE